MNAQFSGKYELLDQIAEEFAERFRKGERPALHEYTQRYPELAAEIRELFPAVVEVERVEPAANTASGTPLRQVGDYRILRQIGRGGMGVVYEAEQSSLGRRVALKVLPLHAGADAKALERFKREARAAAKLHHTNIVPVFDVGEDGEVCFYAMQFIQGQGLDQVLSELRRLRSISARAKQLTVGNEPQTQDLPAELLARSMLTGKYGAQDLTADQNFRNLPLSITEPIAPGVGSSAILPGQTELSAVEKDHRHYFESIARIGRQTASALAHAHERGIIHRDIKPSNLLLDATGTVWVTDFGLAKTEDGDLTCPGDILGTLRYMAPERFKGRSDPRSDVYALGITLYELLVLRPAFEGCDRVTLMAEIANEEPRRPRTLDRRIPRDLETIVMKAIAKDPARRYHTADAMAEDLRRFLEGEPIKARRTSVVERTRLWCRRHKALAGLYVVLFLAAVGASFVAMYLNHLLGESEAQRVRIATAEEQGKEELWKSYLTQARATRMTHKPGQRFDALRAIQAALELPVPAGHSRAELRSEAIAALCLPDVEVDKQWDGYPAGSSSFAIDPTFKRYARADKDGNISIRSIADDQEILRIPSSGPVADYDGLVFSPDGRFLRVDSIKRQVLWRVDGNAPMQSAVFQARVCFSPDSKRLAASDAGGEIRIIDSESGRELRSVEPGIRNYGMVWNPAKPGEMLLADGNSFRLLNTEMGILGPLVSARGEVQAPAWHPEGRLAAFSSGNHHLHLWDVQRRQPVLPPLEGHRCGGILYAFNHAGDLLVSCDWSGLLRFWDTRTGEQLLSLPGGAHTLQFSLDDERFAAAFGAPNKVRLLRVAAGREFRTLAGSGGLLRSNYHDISNVPVHDNGRLLAVRRNDGIALIDFERAEELAVLPTGGGPVAFVDGGRTLLTTAPSGLVRWPVRISGKNGTLIDIGPAQTGPGVLSAEEQQWLRGEEMGRALRSRVSSIGWQSDVRNVDVSPDGRWIATGSGELLRGTGAKVWDAVTRKLVSELPVGRMCRVNFSPDGKWLVTSSGGFRIWETGSWREGPKLGGEEGVACAFSADSRVLALAGKPGVVRLLEPATGRELASLTTAVPSRLLPKRFTPDGSKLIAVAEDTRTLHIFDLELIRAGLRKLDLDWEGGTSDGATEKPAARRFAPLTVRVYKDSPKASPAPTARRDSLRTRLALHTLQIGLIPYHPEPYHQRAHLHEALGQHQKAIADFTAALFWQPADAKRQAHLYEARAMSSRGLKRERDAASDLGKALALEPQNPVLFNNLAQIYLNGPAELRAPGKALDLAERGLRLAPGHWACRNALGVAHYRLNHFDQAVIALERSLRESKGERAAFQLYFLAMCYSRLGDAAKARECYDQAVRWRPEHPERMPSDWRKRLDTIRREADTVLGVKAIDRTNRPVT